MAWLSSRPAGPQHHGELPSVSVDVRAADVLGHADRGDRIEPLTGEVAVVGDADVDPVGQSGRRRPLPRERGLPLGQRDAGDVGAVLARGVQREAAPPAADIEHALAGAQAELRAHELELCALRLLERLRAAREDRALGNQRRTTVIFAADYRGTPRPNVPAGVLGSV